MCFGRSKHIYVYIYMDGWTDGWMGMQSFESPCLAADVPHCNETIHLTTHQSSNSSDPSIIHTSSYSVSITVGLVQNLKACRSHRPSNTFHNCTYNQLV